MSNEPSAEPSYSSESGKAKRKKPTPNLDAIDDPAERRKQRRLAKNRATAAVSRCIQHVKLSTAGVWLLGAFSAVSFLGALYHAVHRYWRCIVDALSAVFAVQWACPTAGRKGVKLQGP